MLIVILDHGIYPLLRKWKVNFWPSWKITRGFILAALTQVAAAIIQSQSHNTIECGDHATVCVEKGIVAPINASVLVIPYILSAAAECFAKSSAYELD